MKPREKIKAKAKWLELEQILFKSYPDTKLKPCPFCGGEAEIEQFGDMRQSTIVACTDCGCRLETCEGYNHGNRWNTRKLMNEKFSFADFWKK